MVPFGFQWPSGLTVNTLWNLWFFGDSSRSIGPFRHIDPKHDLTEKHSKVRRTRCAGVMTKLVKIAIHEQKMTHCRDVVVYNSQDIFLHAFQKLVTVLYETPRRPEDLVIDTVYERLRKKKLLDDGPALET